MATLVQDNVSIEKLLSTWAANGGPSDEEVIEYATAISAQLEDEDMREQFAENVKQVGTWANDVDAAFDRVTRGFADMNDKYGKDFPGFGDYNTEWIGYNQKWVELLAQSRNVASQTTAQLKRFDKVFLDMVLEIKTDQDRLDVITELKSFAAEKNDDAEGMSQGFLKLKRDIEDFVVRLDAFIVQTGNDLAQAAKDLKLAIEKLEGEIKDLDGKIRDSTIALTAMAGAFILIGAVVAGSMLASYKSQRNAKASELSGKQAELADVNRKQEALAHLQSDFDGLKPDIALICEKLSMFASIWAMIQSQTTQFYTALEGGMGATTNIRFKKELKLAKDLCDPLEAGLEKYATELENRQK